MKVKLNEFIDTEQTKVERNQVVPFEKFFTKI